MQLAFRDGHSRAGQAFFLNSLELVLDGWFVPSLVTGNNRRPFHIFSDSSRKRLPQKTKQSDNGPVDLQRLILDLRRVNMVCSTPPSCAMGRLSALAAVDLSDRVVGDRWRYTLYNIR